MSATIEAYNQNDILWMSGKQTKHEGDCSQTIDNSSTIQQFLPCHTPHPPAMQPVKFPDYTPPPSPMPSIKFDALRKFR